MENHSNEKYVDRKIIYKAIKELITKYEANMDVFEETSEEWWFSCNKIKCFHLLLIFVKDTKEVFRSKYLEKDVFTNTDETYDKVDFSKLKQAFKESIQNSIILNEFIKGIDTLIEENKEVNKESVKSLIKTLETSEA